MSDSDTRESDFAPIELGKTAKANAAVDERKLEAAQEALRALEKAGLFRHEYDIASPYESRRMGLRRKE